MPVFGQNINELGVSKYPDVIMIKGRLWRIYSKMKKMITVSRILMH